MKENKELERNFGKKIKLNKLILSVFILDVHLYYIRTKKI